ADLATHLAGDRAEVTAIISGTTQDPHSYEATARDQLTLSRAELVIENGGGFDPFSRTLLDGLQGEAPVVVTGPDVAGQVDADGPAGEHANEHSEGEHSDEHTDDEHAESEQAEAHDHSGHDHAHADGNEHVWYSLATMEALASELSHHLAELDPAGAEEF